MKCFEKNCFANKKSGCLCEILTDSAVDKNGECKFKKKYQDFPKGYEPSVEELMETNLIKKRIKKYGTNVR